MRIIFMGSPFYATSVLEAVLDLGHEVVAVYTQPDKPAGRGRISEPTLIKAFAMGKGLKVFQPVSLRRPEAQQEMAELEPEVVVVAAYGKLLPPEVLSIPRHGYLNVHPSLLPRLRGPSPVASAILQDEEPTGTTIILLDEGMDTGPILAARELRGRVATATGQELTEDLFRLGAGLISEVLPRWVRDELQPNPQDNSLATLTRKLERADGEADWNLAAVELERMCRAYSPWPSLYTSWKGKMLKILSATVVETAGGQEPGLVAPWEPSGAGVVAGQGMLGILTLQLEGKRPVSPGEFLRGYPDFLGSMLPS